MRWRLSLDWIIRLLREVLLCMNYKVEKITMMQRWLKKGLTTIKIGWWQCCHYLLNWERNDHWVQMILGMSSRILMLLAMIMTFVSTWIIRRLSCLYFDLQTDSHDSWFHWFRLWSMQENRLRVKNRTAVALDVNVFTVRVDDLCFWEQETRHRKGRWYSRLLCLLFQCCCSVWSTSQLFLQNIMFRSFMSNFGLLFDLGKTQEAV